MATQSSKRSGRPERGAAAAPIAPSPSGLDALRAEMSTTRRDLIPIPVLVGIFVAVWVLIVWLMLPKFLDDITNYRARRAQARQDWAGSVAPYKALIGAKKNKNYPTFYGELAMSYYHMGNYKESLNYFQQAQERRDNQPRDDQGNAPEPPDYSTMIGLSYLGLNDTPSAEKWLLQAVGSNKLDPAANYALGEIEFKKGNYRKAVDYFKVAIRKPQYEQKVRDYYRKIEEKMFAQPETK